MRQRVTNIDQKTAHLGELLSETSAPGALMRSIKAMEAERERLSMALEGMDSGKAADQALRNITPSDVRKLLRGIAEDIGAATPEELRDALRDTVEKVVLTPTTYDAEIHFRIAPAQKSGVCMASPRGFEPRLSP